MHDLLEELRELQAAGTADAAAIGQARIRESRQPFSLRLELRMALYASVLTLAGGAAVLLRANLDRVGPFALLGAILVAALACYLLALRPRWQRREPTLAHDYLLLLGALLVSAAAGYAEWRLRVFGAGWPRHLLWLAIWHGLTAYYAGSRLVLSLALAAFAAWLGIDASAAQWLRGWQAWRGLAWRAIGCALLFLAAAVLHRRRGNGVAFAEVYEQFSANLAGYATLALLFDPPTRGLGIALLVPLLLTLATTGLRQRRESLVLYAIGYGTVAALGLELQWLGGGQVYLLGLPTVVAAAALLLATRSRLRGGPA